MRTYLVSYDLARPGRNRPLLVAALMSLATAWARPLDNVWYVKAEETPAEIEARLSRLLEEHDGLLVQETRGEPAMLNTGLRWFRQRRPPAPAAANVVPFPFPAADNDRHGPTEAPEVRAAS